MVATNSPLSNSFPKSARLRCSREFHEVIRQGEKKVGHLIVVDSSLHGTGERKLGITASRRFGKSHVRNRFKRIVREAFRTLLSELPAGISLHVKPRAGAEHATMQQVRSELLALLST